MLAARRWRIDPRGATRPVFGGEPNGKPAVTIRILRRTASSIARAACALALLLILAACDQDGGGGNNNNGDDRSGGGVEDEGGEAAVADGRRVFARCQACHEVGAATNRVGPHLVGLFGRPAGGVDGYRYSQALLESGIVWDDATLHTFLRNPRAAVPGNRMSFVGVRDDGELDALIAYLRTATAVD